jgi:hypothetical protein
MPACPRAHSRPWFTGCIAPPSSFLAARMRCNPFLPSRTTSASASITRTVRPHPDAQSVHTPGLKIAAPGTMSSSGTKRMSCVSGTPQLAMAALVPETAVSLMKGAAIHQ